MKYTGASVRQRANRRGKPWEGCLRYKDEDGKWRQTTKVFPATVRSERQANRALSEWRAEMEADAVMAEQSVPSASTLVGDYVEQFIDDLEASGNVERVTVSGYRTTAASIKRAFPSVQLCDLRTAQIQKWENSLTEEGRAPATVLKYHRLLAEVCKHAVAVRDLQWNPCDAVKVPKQKAPSPNSLTAEGAARLRATFEIMGPSPVVTAATIALYTGLREGEVCELKWKDYDEHAGTIQVVEAIGKAKGGTYRKEPKSKSSRRTVPVAPKLAAMLARRRRAMTEELETVGVTLNDAEFSDLYIVGYVDGRYHAPASIGRGWKALSEAFDLTGTQGRRITFHDLRHSFATRAIASGADVKAVASVLGHSNASITLNVYADADPEGKRRAVSLMDKEDEKQGSVRPFAELVTAEA